MAARATIARGCIRGECPQGSLELHVPQHFFQACSLWPAIRARTDAGAELFPGWAGKKVLAELRAFLRRHGWDNAERLGTLSVLQGAARAILSAGGTFAQLLNAGQRRFSAYQQGREAGGVSGGAGHSDRSFRHGTWNTTPQGTNTQLRKRGEEEPDAGPG